jgi:penicillin-binding protein 2
VPVTISRRHFLAASLAKTDTTAAIVLDASTGRVLHSRGPIEARTRPGSTLKPFTALSLDHPPQLPCSGKLRIGNRSLNCGHPITARPLDLAAALAYSCNAYFATASRDFDPARFAGDLRKFGFDVKTPGSTDELALMAIGEWGVQSSVAELAHAYRRLALLKNERVATGLEAAVEYGTARLAQPPGISAAGKTGTTRTHSWFAGWAPRATPRVVIGVALAGGRGGAHAAPIARALFEKWA